MKKLFLLMFAGAVWILFLSGPVSAQEEEATSLTGSIQGLTCVKNDIVCPIGMEGPMVALTEMFVLLVDPATKDYYFFSNVSSKALARFITEEVKVVGYVDNTKKSVAAEEIYRGTTLVWSKKMQEDLRQQMLRHPKKGAPYITN
jgi:hypothetical protein